MEAGRRTNSKKSQVPTVSSPTLQRDSNTTVRVCTQTVVVVNHLLHSSSSHNTKTSVGLPRGLAVGSGPWAVATISRPGKDRSRQGTNARLSETRTVPSILSIQTQTISRIKTQGNNSKNRYERPSSKETPSSRLLASSMARCHSKSSLKRPRSRNMSIKNACASNKKIIIAMTVSNSRNHGAAAKTIRTLSIPHLKLGTIAKE